MASARTWPADGDRTQVPAARIGRRALQTAPSTRIRAGVAAGIALRERLRREVGANERTKLTRTIKLGPIGARIELEEPTEPALFEAMWPLTVNARIRKRRHRVPEGALTWEIDVFLDRDLVLAEVELTEVSQAVEIPDWLAAVHRA
jgi:CYTH domain-containing protein